MKKEIVDVETGEIMYALVPVTRKQHWGGFFMGIQDGFVHIAKLGLEGRTKDVLFYLMGRLDFENWLRISQAEIAEDLNMKRTNVSAAIKELVEHNIINKGPKTGTSFTYRLNPNFGWKGRASNRSRALEEASKRGLKVIEGEK